MRTIHGVSSEVLDHMDTTAAVGDDTNKLRDLEKNYIVAQKRYVNLSCLTSKSSTSYLFGSESSSKYHFWYSSVLIT